MNCDQQPMVAASVFKVEPKQYSNEWLAVRPGRARRPIAEGNKELAIDRARKALQEDGGGVIHILNVHGKVVEGMRISAEGEVVELRTYSPRVRQGSGVAPDTSAILLTAMDAEDELHRLYLVLGHESNEVLAAIDGEEGSAALRRCGFDSGAPALRLHVDMDQLQTCRQEWGPLSSAGVQRRARELCGERSASLDSLANDPRFQSCPEGQRVLAAALWVLWDNRLAPHELQATAGRIVRIGRFLLHIDGHGNVTLEIRSSAEDAICVMTDLAAEQSSQA